MQFQLRWHASLIRLLALSILGDMNKLRQYTSHQMQACALHASAGREWLIPGWVYSVVSFIRPPMTPLVWDGLTRGPDYRTRLECYLTSLSPSVWAGLAREPN
jgi:hypothetical protein